MGMILIYRYAECIVVDDTFCVADDPIAILIGTIPSASEPALLLDEEIWGLEVQTKQPRSIIPPYRIQQAKLFSLLLLINSGRMS
jgi:hypothetical protein